MAYICLNCWQVYDSSIEKIKTNINTSSKFKEIIFCPKADCATGEVVYIDELYLPVIKLLNQKGYLTKFCCSGHVYGKLPDTYIVFNENVKYLPNIPDGADVEKDGAIKISYNYPEDLSELELYYSIVDNANKVLKWSIELPEREIGI